MLLLVALILAAPSNAYRRVAVAHPAPKTIAIDADLGEWNVGMYALSPAINLGGGFIEEGAITNDADHQAEIFVAFGENDLYLAALVADDHVIAESEVWKGDMVELLVERDGASYLHMGVGPKGNVEQFAPVAKKGDATIVAAGQIEARGYVVEARVPYSLLGARPRAGSTLRVNFASRDADPGESPPAHRVWSGYRHNRVVSFGELALQKAPPPPQVDLGRCAVSGPEITIKGPLAANAGRLVAGDKEVLLRIINFQSAQKSWGRFWTDFDLRQIERDLDLARALAANAIRVFPPYAIFAGKPAMIARLRQLIDAAKKRGLLVIPSLFPDRKEFQKERYAAMEAHVAEMGQAFAGESAIAMWDLMNEADHGFGLPDATFTAAEVFAWSRHMAAAMKKADPSHLVTLGLAGYFANRDGAILPEEAMLVGDVLSIHWYFPPERIEHGLARAREAAAGTPLVLQEFGVTSMYEDDASADAIYAKLCSAAEKAKVSGVGAWELFDHPVGTIEYVTPRWTETTESHYGLFRVDGSPKRQAATFCRCLREVPRVVIAPRAP
ncbi:MAG: hypothetical protein IT381_13110 [Deltaproteobacteria bacterium]|nr:hypothetical protein [Deltaproteobacteria bacterium]